MVYIKYVDARIYVYIYIQNSNTMRIFLYYYIYHIVLKLLIIHAHALRQHHACVDGRHHRLDCRPRILLRGDFCQVIQHDDILSYYILYYIMSF